MKTIDDLHDALEALATGSQEPARTPADLLELARATTALGDPSSSGHERHRRSGVLAVAVAVIVIAAVMVWQGGRGATPGTEDVTTSSSDDGTYPSVVVRGDEFANATVAFGRLWVIQSNGERSSAGPTTTIRVFDLATGRLLGKVRDGDGTKLKGSFERSAATDHALWARVVALPLDVADGPSTIYRIDPDTLRAEPNRVLVDGGDLQAFGDRIVAMDQDHLEIVREDGVELAVPSTGTVTGHWTGDPPSSTFGGQFLLHLDARGLWMADMVSSKLFRLDPSTGARLDVASTSGPHPTQDVWDQNLWWFGSQVDSGLGPKTDEARTRFGADLDAPGARVVRSDAAGAGGWQELGPVDGHRILVRRDADGPDHDLLPEFGYLDVLTGKVTPVGGPPARDRRVVTEQGKPWLVSSRAEGENTRVWASPID